MPSWLQENKHLLEPPVNAYRVYNEEFMVMVVGGPNARTDYHINDTAEWFYQYRGSMVLRVVDDGVFRDIVIPERSMMFLPPNTPHNPVRSFNTVGVVVEMRRPAESIDKLRWYCDKCPDGTIVHEATFHCTNLGAQIEKAISDFKTDETKRKCGNCGYLTAWSPE